MTPAVAVLTPSTGICRMGYAHSLARLVSYYAQTPVFEDCETQYLVFDAVEGSGIAENYERLVSRYLADTTVRWTHFLSIEDDMVFAPDCLHTLLRRQVQIVAANYPTNKGWPLRFTAVGLDGQRCETTAARAGIEEVSLVPQGFTLVAREVYEALPKPWYLVGYNPQTGNYVHQDYYFSQQARAAGFSLFVDHDVSKRISHVGPRNWTWEDVTSGE